MDEQVPQTTLGSAEAELVAMEVIGFVGAMLGPSKTGWREQHPNEVGVFNANVAVATADGGYRKVWHGDLNLSADHQKLSELADRLGGRIYLLLEADGRFENEKKPLIANALAWVDPGDDVQLNERMLVWEDRQIRWRARPRGAR